MLLCDGCCWMKKCFGMLRKEHLRNRGCDSEVANETLSELADS
jgi:hypothetical protein